MEVIPTTSSFIRTYLIDDINSVICEYLVYNLHTQEHYAKYGIHELLLYPDKVISNMIDVFDNDIVLEYTIKYRKYITIYTNAFFNNNLDLVKKITAVYQRKYKTAIHHKVFVYIYDNKLHIMPKSAKIPLNCNLNTETIDYLTDLFDNSIDVLKKILKSMIIDGYISYGTFIKTKYYILHGEVCNHDTDNDRNYYELERNYKYISYRFEAKLEINNYYAEIYGFTKAKRYHMFSDNIFAQDVAHIDYRNIYRCIIFQTLIDSLKYRKYSSVKYILDCTDIMIGYDSNTIYEISYNVYKHLVKTFNDIKYDPESMYTLSLRDNDVIGMDFVLPMIDKNKIKLNYLMANTYNSDMYIAWEKFITDMGNLPVYDEFYQTIVSQAMRNGNVAIIKKLISVCYDIKNKCYYDIHKVNHVDMFILIHNTGIFKIINSHDAKNNEEDWDNINKNMDEMTIDHFINSLIYDINTDNSDIIRWLVTNFKYEPDTCIFNKDECISINNIIALSHSMSIHRFIVKYGRNFTVETLIEICEYYNINVMLAFEWIISSVPEIPNLNDYTITLNIGYE